MGLFNPDNYQELQLNRSLFNKKCMLNDTQVVVVYDQEMGVHLAINVFTGQLFENGVVTVSVFRPANNRPSVGIYNRDKRSFELATLSQEIPIVEKWGSTVLQYMDFCVNQELNHLGLHGRALQKPSSLKLDQLISQAVSDFTINRVEPALVAYDMGYRLALKLVSSRDTLVRELKTTPNVILNESFNRGFHSLTQRR